MRSGDRSLILELWSLIWNQGLVGPMINSLVFLYTAFFDNFGLSIIVFTIVARGAMIPLTIKQSRQMKRMNALQPKMKAIQAKYPDDKQRQSQETMKLYRTEGVNPIGCLGPMVLQMPIFFGLFWALRKTLPSTPERLTDLSHALYSWLPQVHQAVPLDSTFIGFDLAKTSAENPIPFLLPILVGGSMWVMQKMSSSVASSPQQESTQRMMLWMFPIMFGFFTLSFEAGLALYWIVSNVIGIVVQGFITGWGPIASLALLRRISGPAESQNQSPATTQAAPVEEVVTDDNDRKDGEDARRGNRARSKRARRRALGSRNRRR